jgi:hypothetical protein
MVDIALLQSVSYMAGAFGVCVAALSFAFNMRVTTKNRKITQTNELLKFFLTLESQKIYYELMEMEWTNYDDFEKKYGTDIGEEGIANCAKRNVFWYGYDTIGRQLKSGLIDKETLYGALGIYVSWMWTKFEPIIYVQRKMYTGSDELEGLEYLAGEMLEMKHVRDPTYRVPEGFSKYVPDK